MRNDIDINRSQAVIRAYQLHFLVTSQVAQIKDSQLAVGYQDPERANVLGLVGGILFAVLAGGIDMADAATTNHVPGGCNVLYLDGHVEFMKYPGVWPVNRYMAFANAVQTIL